LRNHYYDGLFHLSPVAFIGRPGKYLIHANSKSTMIFYTFKHCMTQM